MRNEAQGTDKRVLTGLDSWYTPTGHDVPGNGQHVVSLPPKELLQFSYCDPEPKNTKGLAHEGMPKLQARRGWGNARLCGLNDLNSRRLHTPALVSQTKEKRERNKQHTSISASLVPPELINRRGVALLLFERIVTQAGVARRNLGCLALLAERRVDRKRLRDMGEGARGERKKESARECADRL